MEDISLDDIDWQAAIDSLELPYPPPIGVHNDLLFNEVYGQQRDARVQVFGIQLDEMWSFVQNKKNKQWIWLALNPANRQIVAFHVGGRGKQDAQIFYEAIPEMFKQ